MKEIDVKVVELLYVVRGNESIRCRADVILFYSVFLWIFVERTNVRIQESVVRGF